MIDQELIKRAAASALEPTPRAPTQAPGPGITGAEVAGGVGGGLLGAGAGGVMGAGAGALSGGIRGLITGGIGSIPYHLLRRMGYLRDKGEEDEDISALSDLKKSLMWGGGLGAGAGALTGGVLGAAGGGLLGGVSGAQAVRAAGKTKGK